MSVHLCSECGSHMTQYEPVAAWVFRCPACLAIWHLGDDGQIRRTTEHRKNELLQAEQVERP
jgi:hypothetical protein